MDDTHPSARRVQIELLRQAGPQRRLAMMLELTDWVLQLARGGIARARPNLSESERAIFFVEVHYGPELAQRLRTYLQRRNRA
jgi:hypothetical protein